MYYNTYGYQNAVNGNYDRQTKPNRLTVTGEGTVTATPDEAIITIGVINESPNLSAAQKENTDKMAAVIQA